MQKFTEEIKQTNAKTNEILDTLRELCKTQQSYEKGLIIDAIDIIETARWKTDGKKPLYTGLYFILLEDGVYDLACYSVVNGWEFPFTTDKTQLLSKDENDDSDEQQTELIVAYKWTGIYFDDEEDDKD